MDGQIVKILSDLYYVENNNNTYICKCRGLFRKDKIIPKVGDFVLFDVNKLIIYDILERRNTLNRPPVSNIDIGFIVTSLKIPNFDTDLLDKLILELELNKIEPVIILTKLDLVDDNYFLSIEPTLDYYKSLGYKIYKNTELDIIKKLFNNKTVVFTGQTGAGKSKLLNLLDNNLNLEEGEVSTSLGRGRHTTRTISLYSLYGGKVLDTPGFSSLDFYDFTEEEIRNSFREFKEYNCIYKDCTHTNEEECVIKEMVNKNIILKSRYEFYLKIIKELRKWRKY